MPLEVKLIAHTCDPTRVVAAAAKLCYSPSSASDLFDGLDAAKVRAFLETLRSARHMSPFEHASFTYAIDGISRVATHQIVRHRIASYSQQSQRYVAMGEPCVVIPPKIAAHPEAAELFQEEARKAFSAYRRLLDMGIAKEDARFLLPHGWETSLVLTMNARELHHFFAVRTCRRAQWEIRDLARRMLRLAHETAPELFSSTGPSCITEHACREAHSCGEPYPSVEALLDDAASPEDAERTS